MLFRILEKSRGKATQKCMNLTWLTIWNECIVDELETISASTINQETLMIVRDKLPKLEEHINEVILMKKNLTMKIYLG